jgi:hypothetical protein
VTAVKGEGTKIRIEVRKRKRAFTKKHKKLYLNYLNLYLKDLVLNLT